MNDFPKAPECRIQCQGYSNDFCCGEFCELRARRCAIWSQYLKGKKMSDRTDAIMERVRSLLTAGRLQIKHILSVVESEISAMETDLMQHASENQRLQRKLDSLYMDEESGEKL